MTTAARRWLTRAEIRAGSLDLAEQNRLRAKAARLSLVRPQFRNLDRTACRGRGRSRDRADRSGCPRRRSEGPCRSLSAGTHPRVARFRRKMRAVADVVAVRIRSNLARAPSNGSQRRPSVRRLRISPALQLLLSTSGTTGSRKYVRLSREAIVANAHQIARALAIDERSVGVAHLPLHYSYGLSIVTSHLTAGGRICLVNDSITSPSFWSKIANAGGSHFPGVPFHYAALARLGPRARAGFRQGFHTGRRRARSPLSDEDARLGPNAAANFSSCTARPRLPHAWRLCSMPTLLEKAGSVGVALAGGQVLSR